jgi:hypothetical protein
VCGEGGENGVFGLSKDAKGCGVFGRNDSGDAAAPGGSGVFGLTMAAGGTGVFGANNGPKDGPGRGVQGNGPEAGVGGYSDYGIGVLAQSGGIGVKAQAPIAGRFEGDVHVTGDIQLINEDCAEDFEVSSTEDIAPGTVMVLDDEGALRRSQRSYDRRVAGVVSGAGDFRPAVILGRYPGRGRTVPIALLGKTYCKVDARNSPIAVGDLLTTASTPGCAMRAGDQNKAFGAVIGKALRPLADGLGLIPILIALQ